MSKKHGHGSKVRALPAAVAIADRHEPPAPMPAPRAEGRAVVASALELGWQALRADGTAEALEVCEAVLSLEPQNPDALYLAVTAMHKSELRSAALDLLDRALAANPAAPPMWHAHRGLLLIELDRAREAVESCRAALPAADGDPHLLCVLGLAQKALGRTGPAAAALQRAAARPDAQSSVHGELALVLMAEGRLEAAVKEYATALHQGGQPMPGRHLGAYRTAAVRDWCRGHKASYRVVVPSGAGRTFLPRYGDTPGVCEPVAMPQPEVYLAEVPDASVTGGLGVAVSRDGTVLIDAAFDARAGRFDLAQPSMPFADSRAALVDSLAVAPDPIETGVMLQGPGSTNYYHWLVEHLSRLLVLRLAGVPADIPLLIDARVAAMPQLLDALHAVDADDRPLITLQPGVEYHVERLLVPSPPVWAPSNLRDHLQLEAGDNLVAGEAIEFLRSRLAPPPGTVGRRRIYIARRARTAGLRLVNEPDVQRVFVDAGFEVVSPEALTFAEQRALFNDAAVVAAESGAALANILCAPDSTLLICLQAEAWPMNVYADLVGHAGQPSLFIAGKVESERPPKPYQVRFSVDPEALRPALNRILETHTAAIASRQPEELQ
jgi:capsular polysaccharide biosynthesis protein